METAPVVLQKLSLNWDRGAKQDLASKKTKGSNGLDRQVELRTMDSLVPYGRNARCYAEIAHKLLL